ncbi:MAG: penicillin-binding transpeptidase domain-containing protein [Microgenomates group bacterium]|nr:penicillin-binding transpeptidase domain-containing protein [Microgenomates group bacterium]
MKIKKLPFFEKGHQGNMNFDKNSSDSGWFFYFYIFFIAAFFFVLLIRLFQLTVVKGTYYLSLSEQNRLREVIIEAPRGKIIDRKGFVLAESSDPDLDIFSQRIISKRHYFNPESIAHLVGYRQLADANDLKNDDCLNKLKLGDKVGKKGVEKLFDCDLRGRNGKKLIEVDAFNRPVKNGLINIIAPEQGKTIQLALDSELQQKAFALLSGKKGAIIALKPKTGEILTMVSSPSFNPQDFEDQNHEALENYLKDENHPFFNRASEGAYPPGSVFKLVVATAALEEKLIDEKTVFEDTGKITAGPLTFGNWYFLQYGKTEGMVDVVKALRRSNDIFFYHTGALLGPEKIKFWAEKMGLGKKTNFGLEENAGVIPSSFWKEEVLKERWYLGDTYNLSIGQGYLLVSPLQLAQLTSIFANDGYLCQPQLLKNRRPNCQKIGLSEKTLSLIKEGMKQACFPGGTGWPLFDFKVNVGQEAKPRASNQSPKESTNEADQTKKPPSAFLPIQTACKTGTAEFYSYSKTPHAWFTVYAPADNPEIVLTILVEQGGQGSDVAGPLAKEMLKLYFERNQ